MCQTSLIKQLPARPRGRHPGVEADPELIRRAREEAGLSQAQLGDPLLTRQAVHSIESGRVKPSARSLGHIAKRLGLPVEALLREGGPSAKSRAAELQRLCQARRYDEVVRRAEVLLRVPEASAQLKAAVHHFAGIALYELNRPTEAISRLEEAARHAAEAGAPGMFAESLDWEAAARHLLDDPKALDVAYDALNRYQRLPRREANVELRMLWRVATVLSHHGSYKEAERYYDEALRLADVGRNAENAGTRYHLLAGLSRNAGDLRRALELMRKAVAFFRVDLELRGGKFDLSLISAENDLATTLIEMGHLDEAEGTLAVTLARLDDLGGESERLVPYVLHTRSQLRRAQGRIADALHNARETIALSRRLNLPIPLAEGLQQLGDLYEVERHPRLADRAYQRAIQVLREANEPDRLREVVTAYQSLRLARRTERHRTA